MYTLLFPGQISQPAGLGLIACVCSLVCQLPAAADSPPSPGCLLMGAAYILHSLLRHTSAQQGCTGSTSGARLLPAASGARLAPPVPAAHLVPPHRPGAFWHIFRLRFLRWALPGIEGARQQTHEPLEASVPAERPLACLSVHVDYTVDPAMRATTAGVDPASRSQDHAAVLLEANLDAGY